MRSLAVNPTDPDVVYAVTIAVTAFESTDGGSSWTDITVAGSLLATAATANNGGSSVAYINKGSVSTVMLSTSNGILVPEWLDRRRLEAAY